MECFHPKSIRLPDGSDQVVRCGKCLACLSYRQAGWLVRLRQEIETRGGAYFATLTYNDDHLPMFTPTAWNVLDRTPVPCVSKKDVQKFHMDLRKRFQQGFFLDRSVPGKTIRFRLSSDLRFSFYLTSELGPNGKRPHYHGIYFGLPDDPFLVELLFRDTWKNGFITCEPAQSSAAAAYVSKYLINDSFVPLPTNDPGYPRMFSLMSKGLGSSYLDNEKLMDWHRSAPLDRCFHPDGSKREILPRYWKDRIFDSDMRASLLDKALDLSRAKEEALSVMEDAERFGYLENLNHLEQEAERQAEWRFRKNGKLK